MDSGGLGHSLAFLDQRVQKMAEIGKFRFVREVRRVRQSRQRRHAVYRRIENQLGPLRGPGVFEYLGFESGGNDKVGGLLNYREWCGRGFEGAHPGWGIEFILYVRVAVTRAAHE